MAWTERTTLVATTLASLFVIGLVGWQIAYRAEKRAERDQKREAAK